MKKIFIPLFISTLLLSCNSSIEKNSSQKEIQSTRTDNGDTTFVFGNSVLVNYAFLLEEDPKRNVSSDKIHFQDLLDKIKDKVSPSVYVGITDKRFISIVDASGNKIMGTYLGTLPNKCIVTRSDGQLIPIKNILDMEEINTALNQPISDSLSNSLQKGLDKKRIEEEYRQKQNDANSTAPTITK